MCVNKWLVLYFSCGKEVVKKYPIDSRGMTRRAHPNGQIKRRNNGLNTFPIPIGGEGGEEMDEIIQFPWERRKYGSRIWVVGQWLTRHLHLHLLRN